MRIEVIRDIKEIEKLENSENRKILKKQIQFFSKRTFSLGLYYEPGLKGPPAAAHDPGYMEAL
jgi:uncharacterized protein YwgA